MAYDLRLAEHIRSHLDGLPFVERKMFGDVGFLLNGNMVCGVNKDDPVLRVDPERHGALIKKPHAKPYDLPGKLITGWLLVEPGGVKTDKQLSGWVTEGVEIAFTLPSKWGSIQ